MNEESFLISQGQQVPLASALTTELQYLNWAYGIIVVLQPCERTPSLPGDRVDNDCDGKIDEEICSMESRGNFLLSQHWFGGMSHHTSISNSRYKNTKEKLSLDFFACCL